MEAKEPLVLDSPRSYVVIPFPHGNTEDRKPKVNDNTYGWGNEPVEPVLNGGYFRLWLT